MGDEECGGFDDVGLHYPKGRGVCDIAFILADGTVVFWDLKETSGTKKNKRLLRDFIIAAAKDPSLPYDIMDLETIIMYNIYLPRRPSLNSQPLLG